MADLTDGPAAGPGRAPRLDPEIARFRDGIAADAAAFPDPTAIPVAEARRNAAAVRARWARGGPAMARTETFPLDTAAGPVPVRLHAPRAAPDLPALIYLHGGGWTFLDLDTHDRVMREIAAAAGIAVVGVDYPLAPEHPYPAALDACAAVARRLAADGGAWGLDPARLAIGGDSAGANLALGTCLALRDAGEAPIRAAMLAYGAYDPATDRPSVRTYGDGSYLLSEARMRWFWSNYLGRAAGRPDARAAPLSADLRGLPPMFLAVAEIDVLHDENLELADRFRDAGVTVEAAVYPGTIHAFLEAAEVAAVARAAIAAAGAFLRRHLT